MRLGTALLLVLCTACGGGQAARSLSYGENARRAYENAFQAYEDRDCMTAEPLFRRIQTDYPYSRYAALAELRLADCALLQSHFTEAIRAYRSFVRHRPAHAEVPYAHFKIAEAYFKQIPGDFFLSAPAYERDQAPTRSALRQLRRFLLEHPDNDHATEARDMVRRALDLLARHELYVAEFYLGRDQPRAAILRLRHLLSVYEGSGIEPQALLLLGRVHLHMREVRDAQRTFEELVQRFPESGWSEQARGFLRQIVPTQSVPTQAPAAQSTQSAG
ncbi:MAG: outer membrane protein assembly factor BamD [Sandaracinaceae bacterium]|nr:outer membrane protein assembly factor BamD [Sandaracinaceae bacterium]